MIAPPRQSLNYILYYYKPPALPPPQGKVGICFPQYNKGVEPGNAWAILWNSGSATTSMNIYCTFCPLP